MDRRALVTGLFGIAGAATLAAVIPPQYEALAGVPDDDIGSGKNVLPDLEKLKADPEDIGSSPTPASGEDLEEMAYHYGYSHRRRRRRVRRWRRHCRRYRWYGRWRRRCRRRPFWIWIGIG